MLPQVAWLCLVSIEQGDCAKWCQRSRRYKYIHMEEMLGNVAGARQIFERWMKWEPDHNGWSAYIKVSCVTPAPH